MLKLARPIIARIATITDWPLILIDLTTKEGVVGRSYLEPYSVKAMKYLIPALHDLGDMLAGRDVAPVDIYEAVREAVGEDIELMVDFNQGLSLGEALIRCHAIDDLGLAWIEEPIVHDNLDGFARLAAELKTPIQIGENHNRLVTPA